MFRRIGLLAPQPAWHEDVPAKQRGGDRARLVQALLETVLETDRATLARESNAP